MLAAKLSLEAPVCALPSLVVKSAHLLLEPGDDSKGYFIQPTVIVTKDPKSITMSEEIFGPVLTVSAFKIWHPSVILIRSQDIRFRGQ